MPFIYEKPGDGSGGGPIAEVDPTVPDWAKQPDKPEYTADEVGAANYYFAVCPSSGAVVTKN
jgi:hypothetical protein